MAIPSQDFASSARNAAGGGAAALGVRLPAGVAPAPAKLLKVLDLERERRFAKAEALVAEQRLAEVRESSPAAIRHAKEFGAAASATAEEEDRAWRERVLPAVATVREQPGPPSGGGNDVRDLAGLLGTTVDADLLERFMDTDREFVPGDSTGVVTGSPSDREVESFFGPEELSSQFVAHPLVRASQDSPNLCVEAATVGLHLTRPGRRAGKVGHRGLVFDHHGLFLGDGTVIHFDGEPSDPRPAVVRRTSLTTFLGGRGTSELGVVCPTAIRGRDPGCLRGSISSLRALAQIGDEDYRLGARNCEHFALWASLGADHSTQTTVLGQVARIAAMAPGPLADVAQELFNAVLAEDVKLSRRKAPTVLPDTEVSGVLALDLARAYWFEDLGGPAARFPIWADGFALGGFADHSWCRGLPGESNWEATCPGLEQVPGWHASLIALVGTPEAERSVFDFRWVTSDGRCYRPDAVDILSIVERRLEPTRRMHDALFSGATTTVRRILGLKGSGFGSDG